MNKLKALEKDFNQLAEKEETSGLVEAEISLRRELDIRINKLANECSLAEENLKSMLGLEEEAQKIMGKVKERDTFDDDDFFDQTKSAKNLRNTQQQARTPGQARFAEDLPGKAENFASLRGDYESMLLEKAKVSKELYRLAMNEPGDGDGELDELDLYMRQNNEVLKTEKKASLIARMKELQVSLDETSGLMNYIKPNVRLESEDDIMKRYFWVFWGWKCFF
jgi:hypothetical protein